MLACSSALDPAVSVPKAARIGALPGPWRDWFWRVLQQGERSAPPCELTAPAAPAVGDPLICVEGLLAQVEGGFLVLDAPCAQPIAADEALQFGERIWVRQGGKLLEVHFHWPGRSPLLVSTRLAAQVHPHTTRCFEGVALQQLYGGWWAIFPRSRGLHSVALPLGAEQRVSDARFDGARLVLTVDNGGGSRELAYRVTQHGAEPIP